MRNEISLSAPKFGADFAAIAKEGWYKSPASAAALPWEWL
jgi:hypothetical protein